MAALHITRTVVVVFLLIAVFSFIEWERFITGQCFFVWDAILERYFMVCVWNSPRSDHPLDLRYPVLFPNKLGAVVTGLWVRLHAHHARTPPGDRGHPATDTRHRFTAG